MKRNLFILSAMFCIHSIMSQNIIVCTVEGELPKLLEENAQDKTELAISGPLSAEDIKAIGKYPKINYLYLRDAQLSTIPEYAWSDLHALCLVELPLEIDTLNLNAFPVQSEIRLILTGDFPYLQNQPKDSLGIPLSSFPEFIVWENNEKLSYYDYLNGMGVYSANGKILYKSFIARGTAAEEVMPYAYQNVRGSNYVCIEFGENLKRIANNAFAGFEYMGMTVISGAGRGLDIVFKGDTPPEKFGEGNLNVGYIYPLDYDCGPMQIVVPNKEVYVNADSSWGELFLINESDWVRGNTNIKSMSTDEDVPYYDLMGRKVTHPTRGIYIKDGRKVVIE